VLNRGNGIRASFPIRKKRAMKNSNQTAIIDWFTHGQICDQPATDTHWYEFVQEASATGLAGVALEHAKQSNIDLPPDCIVRLKQSAFHVATHNLNLQSKLETILAAFNEVGIDVMLLKGAALYGQIYDGPNLRPMSDVDLLLKAQDVKAATLLLKKVGCVQGMDLVHENHFPTYYYESEYISFGPNPIRLDVHVRPFRPTRYAQLIPEDQFWNNARSVRVGQATAKIPNEETMLIHLAAHAAFHECSRLIWLYDLKRWCDTYSQEMDWSLVLTRAKAWHRIAPVQRALSIAESTWGPFLPKLFREKLAKLKASWKDRLTLWHTPRDANHPLGHLLVDLLTTPGIRFRLGYARNLLLPSTSHLAEIYPYRHAGWRGVANLWRGGRLALRSLRSGFRRLAMY